LGWRELPWPFRFWHSLIIDDATRALPNEVEIAIGGRNNEFPYRNRFTWLMSKCGL
jgi:hypothetical protein